MTIRHYYQDATTKRFSATVTERLIHNDRPAVLLDATYFYPTSGGQPHDTGRLSDGQATVAVVDVWSPKPGDPVVHILNQPWTGKDEVIGEIDWLRRFDHMQQHTGQHILSQALIRVAETETVGFHLSKQTVTIDLDTAELTSEQIQAAEQLANEIIWANVPVDIRFASPEEASRLSLRKIPTKYDGEIRLIAIGDFDLTACGGTHVTATGQIGQIKLLKTERRGDSTRLEFCCGMRALDDYRHKHAVLTDLNSTLTTGYDDLAPSIGRLQEEARQWRTTASVLQKELSGYEANRLIEETQPRKGSAS
ncbi:MAG: alanyl-tRNA editing protein [Chloroflexota bacterium]